MSSPSCTAANHAERIALEQQGNLGTTPAPIPFIGFAISALPPSAAMVSAGRQIDHGAPTSGRSPNSLKAALIQETGLVHVGVIVWRCLYSMLSYLTTARNGRLFRVFSRRRLASVLRFALRGRRRVGSRSLVMGLFRICNGRRLVPQVFANWSSKALKSPRRAAAADRR